MTEHDVGEVLRRRAGDATVSSDAWDRIAERIADDGEAPEVVELAPRRRLNRSVVMGAMAAAMLVVLASVAALRDGETYIETVRAADQPSTATSGPQPATGQSDTAPPSGPRPLWPATTDEELVALQADADAGRRPDLLDPAAVAGAYLSDRFLDAATRRLRQDFAIGGLAQGDSTSGEVPYQSPPASAAGGTVLVRRAGGEGAIWFVVGSTSSGVDVHRAAYDGSELTGEAAVTRPGTLTVTVASTDGSGAASSESQAVAPARTIALSRRFAGKPGVMVQLRLVEAPSGAVSFAELRLDRGAATPVPEATFQTTAEAATRRWIRALAVGDGDLAWDLLAEASRSAIGGRPGFDSQLAGLAEGWGAWDAAPAASYRAVPLVGDAGEDEVDVLPAALPRLGVVLVAGRVSQEGATAYRTMSLPVRGTKEKVQVDPFVDAPVELVPADGGRVSLASTFAAYTASGAKIWFLFDDRAPVGPDTSEGADGDQQRVTVTPLPVLSSGRHSLTLVALTVDGRVVSRSATFVVA